MCFHRFLSVCTLVTYLPMASGCVSRTVLDVGCDPAATAGVIAEREAIEIEGYTLASGRHVDWLGQVVLVGADSLLFTPRVRDSTVKPATFGSRSQTNERSAEPFALDLRDVQSIDLVEADPVRTVLLEVGVVLGVAAVFLAMFAAGMSNMKLM